MQDNDGRMRSLSNQEFEKAMQDGMKNKVIQTGLYFKIKQTYFKIDHLTDIGFVARGVSRKEYFKNKR